MFELDFDTSRNQHPFSFKRAIQFHKVDFQYTNTRILKELTMVLPAHKWTVILGESGVGKSTILNFLNPEYNIWVEDISNKTKRGKHTTRAATLYEFFDNSFIIDTAGFTSLDLTKFIDSEVQIRDAFVEFEFGSKCKFSDCKHINEPDCYVKSKLESGSISKSRYDSYIFYLNEYLKNRRY